MSSYSDVDECTVSGCERKSRGDKCLKHREANGPNLAEAIELATKTEASK